MFCPFLSTTPTYWGMWSLHMGIINWPSMIGSGRLQICLYCHCMLCRLLQLSDTSRSVHAGYMLSAIAIKLTVDGIMCSDLLFSRQLCRFCFPWSLLWWWGASPQRGAALGYSYWLQPENWPCTLKNRQNNWWKVSAWTYIHVHTNVDATLA